MSSALLFSFRQIPIIVAMLEERGVDVAELLREAGLPPEARDGEITAPLARIATFVDRAADRLQAPLFGIDLAERIPRGSFGLAEFVIRAAPTVRQALEALCELGPLINAALEMRYVADTRGCEIRYTFGTLRDGLGMHLNEFTVTFVAASFGSLLGRSLPLERAWFAHGRRDHADDVAARLRCPVSFQAADTGFAVTSEIIEEQPASADPQLFAFLLAQAREKLASLGGNQIVAQVTRAVEAQFARGTIINVTSIADALVTTPRSLQRHLADAGTSFREVLAHVRRRRRAELERTGLAESEIAVRLGFADARSMRRSLDDGSDDA